MMIKYRVYSYNEDEKCYDLIATVDNEDGLLMYKLILIDGYITKETNPLDPYESVEIWSTRH